MRGVVAQVVEIDEWLLDFADAFKAKLALGEGESVDINGMGYDKAYEALEAVMASPDAGRLMAAASAKFQEAAAAALYNWGNVHVCLGRKITEVAAQELLRESVAKAATAEPDVRPLPPYPSRPAVHVHMYVFLSCCHCH